MKGKGLAIILAGKKPAMDEDEEEAPPSSKREAADASQELIPMMKAQWAALQAGDFKKAAKLEAEMHRVCDSYMEDEEDEGEEDEDEEKY